MDKFLSAHATHGEPNAEQICAGLVAELGTVPAAANLGFLYVTDALADQAQELITRLRNRTGVTHWVGSVGMGICSLGQEFYDTPAASILIGAFPEDAFRVFSVVTDGLENFVAQFGPWCRHSAAHVAVVHGDPTNPDLPRLITEFSQTLPDAFLIGGLTSSNARYMQIADQAVHGGLSGVIFDEHVAIITGLSQGCTPIGARHVITQCSHNIISRLDDRPALDVLNEDIGELLARDLNRVAGYIFVGLPVAGSDQADYLVRNLIGVDMPGKRIGVGDQVEVGQQLMFCRRDASTAREDLQRMLVDLVARNGRQARGAVYFSCVGRGRYLFGTQSEELRTVRAALGDIPLAGFYANGEIFHDRLYGFTGVLSLFL